jgi:hypothetical protein
MTLRNIIVTEIRQRKGKILNDLPYIWNLKMSIPQKQRIE